MIKIVKITKDDVDACSDECDSCERTLKITENCYLVPNPCCNALICKDCIKKAIKLMKETES